MVMGNASLRAPNPEYSGTSRLVMTAALSRVLSIRPVSPTHSIQNSGPCICSAIRSIAASWRCASSRARSLSSFDFRLRFSRHHETTAPAIARAAQAADIQAGQFITGPYNVRSVK